MGKVVGGTITTPINTYNKKQIETLVDGKLGDVETALNDIIAVQYELMGEKEIEIPSEPENPPEVELPIEPGDGNSGFEW